MKHKHECRPPAPPWEVVRQNPCMLCGEIGRLLHQQMREGTERAGINPSYRPFIHFLNEHDGVTQLDLVKVTHLAAPTVSVTLQKMEQEGLVTRRIDPEDQRQVLVYITGAGRDLHQKVREQIVKTEQRALSGVTEEERQQLLAILSHMRDNLVGERREGTSHEAD